MENKRDFDSAAKLWDDNERRVKMVYDIAIAMKESVSIEDSMDILDFGCGTGLLSMQFQPFVKSLTGADSSRGMIDVLAGKIEQQGITNFRLLHLEDGNIEKLTGEYDLVISSMTIHHVKEITPLLYKFSEILKPGGHLCIADLDPDRGLFHADNTGVFHNGFDRGVMKSLLERAGFTNVKTSTAAEVMRPGPDGEDLTFTIFLLCGTR